MQQKTLVLTIPYLDPHRPPITGALLGQIAQNCGHSVAAIDLNILLFRDDSDLWWESKKKTYSYDFDNPAEVVPVKLYENLLSDKLNVDWILLTQLTMFDFPTLHHICKWLRQRTKAKIVIGGPGIESAIKENLTYGQFLFDQKLVDYYVYGEGENALKSLFEGNIEYPGINGKPPVQIDNIDDLPLPNYDFYDLNLYHYPSNEKDFHIYGSRGCVKRCTFCDVRHYWPKYRYRSGKNIAKEMIDNFEKYGTKSFYFSDSLLNGSLKEFRVFCETLSQYAPAKDFKWSGFFLIRPKQSHNSELFDMIKSSGGYYLNCGVETGVDRIRLEMLKGFVNDDVDWHLENCSKHGLTNQFQLISTWPTETVEEHHEYLKVFKRWHPYVADGTISSASINGHPSWLIGGGLDTENDLYADTRLDSTSAVNKVLFYRSKKNPKFTVTERYQRTINIIMEARRYGWPLDRIETKIIEWIEQLKLYKI